jgi:hypothetical protein
MDASMPTVGTRFARPGESTRRNTGTLVCVGPCAQGFYLWAGIIETDDGPIDFITDKSLLMEHWLELK